MLSPTAKTGAEVTVCFRWQNVVFAIIGKKVGLSFMARPPCSMLHIYQWQTNISLLV